MLRRHPPPAKGGALGLTCEEARLVNGVNKRGCEWGRQIGGSQEIPKQVRASGSPVDHGFLHDTEDFPVRQRGLGPALNLSKAMVGELC